MDLRTSSVFKKARTSVRLDERGLPFQHVTFRGTSKPIKYPTLLFVPSPYFYPLLNLTIPISETECKNGGRNSRTVQKLGMRRRYKEQGATKTELQNKATVLLGRENQFYFNQSSCFSGLTPFFLFVTQSPLSTQM